MVKRRVKKKRRVVKKRQATVKTEPVDRRPLLGGGGSFSILPANPFQEGVQNMMTAMQQNLNNNVNNALNTMRAENQIMNDRLRTLQYEQQTAMERGNQLMAVQLREQIDNYSKALDTKYGMMNQIEEWISKGLQLGQHGRPVRKRAPQKSIGLDDVEGTNAEPLEPPEHTPTEDDDNDPPHPKVERVNDDRLGREIKREVKPLDEGQASTPTTTTIASSAEPPQETEAKKRLVADLKTLTPEQRQQYAHIMKSGIERRTNPKKHGHDIRTNPKPKKTDSP